MANVANDYSDEDAVVTFLHENGCQLVLKLHPDRTCQAFVVVSEGHAPATSSGFLKAFPIELIVVPTLSPLEDQEPYVADETVRRNETTRLASRNFRNIWLRADKEAFGEFKTLVEESWSGVTLQKPEFVRLDKPIVQMFFEERRIPREVYWAGFGFQAWIQMIHHLMRGGEQSILVLDEPDVYLHPDLQKRLYRLISSRFGQSFVATHSTEIVNEANPGDILLVSRNGRSAQRVVSDEAYRQAYAYLGSSENADFARIARAKRVVFFEGKDRRIVRRFAAKAGFKDGPLDDPDTVYLQAGGYEQWRRVREVGWTLHHVFGLDVKIAAIFDRDYRCSEEMEVFEDGMNSEKLLCVALSRKEIENYALERPVLFRAMRARLKSRSLSLSDSDLLKIIDKICASMCEETRSNTVSNYADYKFKLDPEREYEEWRDEALTEFDIAWASSLDQRLSRVSGKTFISILSAVFQKEYGLSITVNHIVEEFEAAEIPAEVTEILGRVSRFLE
jgi:hypothetical protein